MRLERYSIEVSDDVVEIFGNLTIEEAFDFLSFFEKKGYTSLVSGYETTLRMTKPDEEELDDEEESLHPFDRKYSKDKPIPRCCPTQEKQERYEKLLQLKNEFPNLRMPSPSDYYINTDPSKE